MLLVDCHVEGFPFHLHHFFQGKYVLLNYIDFDGVDRKIFRNCVDEIQGRGKSDTPKKVGCSTVYGTE